MVQVPEENLGHILDVEFERGWSVATSLTEKDYALMNYYQELYTNDNI